VDHPWKYNSELEKLIAKEIELFGRGEIKSPELYRFNDK
jgi:hypothetical protein